MHFHELRIKTRRLLTDDALAISFAVPDALKASYQFTPGQYLTLRANIGGEDVRRSYSICSYHRAADPEVGIRHVPHGLFSNYLFSRAVGDSLQVMTPQGQFKAPVGGTHHYLLLTAGSGITPCLSIATSVLQDEPDSRITLVYGNRSTASTMFRSELNALKDRFTSRFIAVYLMSREPQSIDRLGGRLNGDKLRELIDCGMLDPARHDAIYLCGPLDMIDSMRQTLQQHAVPADHIHAELFTTAGSSASSTRASAGTLNPPESTPASGSTDPAGAAGTGASKGAAVTIILDGIRRQIRVDANEETVLTAARRQGIDLPYSCAGGMCCTCRCKILSGRSQMDVNYSLQAWEIEAGFTLACQTRPESATMVLDFDAS